MIPILWERIIRGAKESRLILYEQLPLAEKEWLDWELKPWWKQWWAYTWWWIKTRKKYRPPSYDYPPLLSEGKAGVVHIPRIAWLMEDEGSGSCSES